ncbi:MAG TPA: hypothetical protein VMS43_01225 [Allosphingosinicella sp.]|nr:hypothetical protein [Allosphingosinicella sp.]
MARQAEELIEAVGTQVALTGTAVDYKAGAVLEVAGDRPVFLDGVHYWPAETRGKRMTVRGVLRHRPAGIPVADGPVPAQRMRGDKWWIERPAYEVAP